MKLNRLSSVIIGLVFLLGACASSESPTASSESPAASLSVADSPVADAATSPETTTTSPEATDHSAPQQGGQVVEVGNYHLELVALPEASGTHLDLFLQTGDTHAAIEGATVTGQVQLPDGAQRQVDFEYDAEGKHYVALLPETASGEYKVAILTDINGEKVNGRFTFTK
ncbi:hypothetical protein [Leptothoe sp. PORK10 BA2]|uniref:hypothetical protein n=1 Tax=Leptothoe sp. PORK10 BA2 TaxID=3110254 RepID=UPI002B1F617D|nr:hypothetical protein [Leptothoe sp. PORK10 BA2]MEA5463601.1 hypothetical protein [Leptothoe sp. PORK10 BA2]